MDDWLEIDLRSLRLGELLDRTFELYRRPFALFTGILLIPQCIMLVGQLLLEGLLNPIVGAKPGHFGNPAAVFQDLQRTAAFRRWRCAAVFCDTLFPESLRNTNTREGEIPDA